MEYQQNSTNTRAVTTRFAPSPTGFMHIGNLRTALYAYLLARANGGTFILRIEDTDQERLVAGATEVILKTMDITGLNYDEGPNRGGPHGPYIQSERASIYRDYAQQLVEAGQAYYCFCSKERLDKLHELGDSNGYDRCCRELSEEEINKNLAAGIAYVIRQKIPLAGITTYNDEVFGIISIENKELQDQILIKADGWPTYNFAHVIDDHLMGVTHVVRGSEYLTSTPKYVLLYDAFAWKRPYYVHLPLLMGKGEDGAIAKLSKRHGAVSFQDLLAAGYLPEAIINYIALLGWCPKESTQEFFSLQELVQEFSLAGIGKSPSVFDYNKLLWFNSEYIKKLPAVAFYQAAIPYITKLYPSCAAPKQLCELLQPRIATLAEIPEKIAFLTQRVNYDLELYRNKKNKTTPQSSLAVLVAVQDSLQAIAVWNSDNLALPLAKYAATNNIKMGAMMVAIRVAIARVAVTPGGATELMEVLGKQESLARIEQAIAELTYYCRA